MTIFFNFISKIKYIFIILILYNIITIFIYYKHVEDSINTELIGLSAADEIYYRNDIAAGFTSKICNVFYFISFFLLALELSDGYSKKTSKFLVYLIFVMAIFLIAFVFYYFYECYIIYLNQIMLKKTLILIFKGLGMSVLALVLAVFSYIKIQIDE